MCRAIEEIRRQERAEAWQEARQEAWQEAWKECNEKKDLESIQTLMGKTGWTIAQTMEMLDIPAEDRKRYQTLLENRLEEHAAKPSA